MNTRVMIAALVAVGCAGPSGEPARYWGSGDASVERQDAGRGGPPDYGPVTCSVDVEVCNQGVPRCRVSGDSDEYVVPVCRPEEDEPDCGIDTSGEWVAVEAYCGAPIPDCVEDGSGDVVPVCEGGSSPQCPDGSDVVCDPMIGPACRVDGGRLSAAAPYCR